MRAVCWIALVGAACAMSSRAAAKPCDQTCLRGFTQQYLDALTDGDPASLPLAAAVKFTENGQTLAFGQGLWQAKVAFGGYRFFIEDPSSSRAAFVGALQQNGEPAIL